MIMGRWSAPADSRRGRRVRVVALLAGTALVVSGCYVEAADQIQRTRPEARPWFCNGTGDGTPISGHGNGNHMHPFYAGKVKGPLSWDDCKALARQFDQALAYASQWPTKGRAEAGGWGQIAPYYPGLGTHHYRDLAGAIGRRNVFDPAQPQFLIYGGTTADAPLVGLAYSSLEPTSATPPEGFVGGNDWYHLHARVCFGAGGVLAGAEDISDSACSALGGSQIPLGNLFLLHAWIFPGYEYRRDVFISGHECMTATGPAPAGDPCWERAWRDPADEPPSTSTTMPDHSGDH
jgi:hypothetical protein